MNTKKAAPTVNAQQIEAAVAANARKLEDAVTVGKQTVEKTVEATKVQVDKAATAAIKNFDDAATTSKAQVDAVMLSATVFAKGMEEISRAWFELAQANAEAQVEASKAMFGAKNVNELLDAQNEVMRGGFDKFVSESSRISEMSFKVANDAAAPLQAYANSAFDKFTKQFAA